MRASYAVLMMLMSTAFVGLIYGVFYDILLQMIANGSSTGYNTGFWDLALDTLNMYFPLAYILSIPLWAIVNAQRPQPDEG